MDCGVNPSGRTSTKIVKRQCERLEAIFIGVSAIARLVSPKKRRFRASSSELAVCMLRFLALGLE